ncbi:heme o synthase [Paenibacillus sp. CECT 9249]|uniref:heme o synthase n=1 Tax=unclassified Paenibacillus TaxID=185978 RepID=UPI001C1199B2|nr:heme o synthase [Paenibacillus sp. CECT 9249]MBU5441447.1 heme o synthase [Paenibacillus sp. MSJ-34]CAH0118316.1 Protoheme IX farnesyltransferase 1 [Paenibacillus sp. CECT 9249]
MDKQLGYQVPSDSVSIPNPSIASKKEGKWKEFIRVTKPGILRSNLFAAFAGYWVASQWEIYIPTLLWMLLGTAFVLASSCAFNNVYDRELDAKMERTRTRALPAGRLQPKTVIWYATILGVLGLAILFILDPLVGAIGALGMIGYDVVYTMWLKRSSTWSTSIGAIGGAMPPLIGYVAAAGVVDQGALLVYAIMFLWQPPHFWALGIRRLEEYRQAGYPLLPVVKGIKRTKYQMIPYLVLLIVASVLLYAFGYVGVFYLIVALITGIAWLWISLSGFKAKDENLWAKKTFLFSINYLMITFLVMIIDTVHK